MSAKTTATCGFWLSIPSENSSWRLAALGKARGEFQAAYSAVTFRDGTMAVPDYGRKAYHVFRPGGELSHTVYFPPGHGKQPSGWRANLPSSMSTHLLRAEAGGTLLGYPYLILAVSASEAPNGDFSYSSMQRSGPRVLERLSIDGNRLGIEEVVEGLGSGGSHAEAGFCAETPVRCPSRWWVRVLGFDRIRDQVR